MALIAAIRETARWKPTDPQGVRPWTDDYVNLVGALWRRLKQKMDPNSDV